MVAAWSRDLFWWCQTAQAVTANRGNQFGKDCTDRTRSEKGAAGTPWLTSQPNLLCHTWRTLKQPHRACNTSSGCSEQRWQTFSDTIVFFKRFSFVGKEFVQDFQRKCLIFPGTFRLQTLFQKPLAAPTVSWSCSPANWSSQRHLYPDLTENFPPLSAGQTRESDWGIKQRGRDLMVLASGGKKTLVNQVNIPPTRVRVNECIHCGIRCKDPSVEKDSAIIWVWKPCIFENPDVIAIPNLPTSISFD